MRLRMTRTSYGAPDGIQVNEYKRGQEFAVGDGLMPFRLAEMFVEIGAASFVQDAASSAPRSTPAQADLVRAQAEAELAASSATRAQAAADDAQRQAEDEARGAGSVAHLDTPAAEKPADAEKPSAKKK